MYLSQSAISTILSIVVWLFYITFATRAVDGGYPALVASVKYVAFTDLFTETIYITILRGT